MRLYNHRLGKFIEARSVHFEIGVYAPDHHADLNYETSYFQLSDFNFNIVENAS